MALIVELVACGDVGLEQEVQRLMEVVDVPETDVDVQFVLLDALIGPEQMRLVRLGRSLVARNLY